MDPDSFMNISIRFTDFFKKEKFKICFLYFALQRLLSYDNWSVVNS